MNLRWLLYSALALLVIFHHDVWNWSAPARVLGLPAGLLYHVLFCLVVALVMRLLLALDRSGRG